MPKRKTTRAPSGKAVAKPKRKPSGRPTKEPKRAGSRRPTKTAARKAQKEFDGSEDAQARMESDFRKTVGTMKKSWNEAKKKKISGIFEPPDIPDGTYFAQVTDCRVQRFGQDGDFFLETIYQIQGGRHDNVEIRSILGMSEEPAFGEFLRIDLVLDQLRKLGMDVDNVDSTGVWDLAAEVDEDKAHVKVGVKNDRKGDKHYQNVRIQKLLTADDLAALN